MASGKEKTTLTSYVEKRGDLVALANAVVQNHAIAEELVQDGWLRWSAKQYPLQDARPILIRIIRNLALDWHRRNRREVDAMDAYKLTRADAPDSERVVMARQELERVIKALQELPDQALIAFRLSRVEGLTLKETGRRLGVSETRAYQLVSKALLHVISALDD